MILIFPGFLGQKSDFSVLQNSLKLAGIETYVLDFFSNNSPLPPENWQDWNHKALDFILRLNPQPKMALGYSLGGRLLLNLQAKTHFSIPSLFFSTHPGFETIQEREERRTKDLEWARKFLTLEWSSLMKEWQSQEVFSDTKSLDRAEKDYDRKKLAEAFHYFSLSLQENHRDYLGERGPQSFLWCVGEKDEKFKKKAHYLKNSRSNFPLEIIPAAGHRVLWDNPTEVFSLATRFYLKMSPR